MLYDISDRPVYVGQGQVIRTRIRDHSEDKWFVRPFIETAAYVEIRDEQLRKSVENVLIRFMKPNAVINKQGVRR